ncbi:hypothetical protein TNCV_22401, partial [Trichonephila clavipes]
MGWEVTSESARVCASFVGRVAAVRSDGWQKGRIMAELSGRSQFGFRENRSCIEAVDKLVHHIKNTRVNKHTASTFIDIKSAFDNVDWSTLFHIFHSYRIPLHFQKFIHSYLTNR